MKRRITPGHLAVSLVLAMGALPFAAMADAPSPAPAYNWQSLPYGGGGFIDGFAYHPRVADVLYARTDVGGLYRFDRAASRWVQLLDGTGRDDGDLMGVLSVALDPADANKVYAATGLYLPDWARKGAILRSTDRGRTWQRADLPIHVGGNSEGRGTGERLVVDPRDPSVLYYGSNQDGLWKSTNGAVSFARTGAAIRAFSMVVVDPTDHNTLYAGTSDGEGALMVSHDGGQSFARVPQTPAMTPQRAAFGADGALYVTFAAGDAGAIVNPNGATRGAVWRRDAKGAWTAITPTGPDVKGGFSGVDVGPDGTLAVSTIDRWALGDDVFLSHDHGAHWQAQGERSHHNPGAHPWLVDFMDGKDRMGHWISDLKINPFNPDEMIYGTGFGLWMSRNLVSGKQTVEYDFAVDNLEETVAMAITSPNGGAAVLAALADVGGGAWDDVAKSPAHGLFTPTRESNFSVDVAWLNPAIVVRTANNADKAGYISTNGGADWTAFPAHPYRPAPAGQPWRSAGLIAVSAKGTSMVWAPQRDTLYHSADGGRHWAPAAGLPAPDDNGFTPIADKAVDGVFYLFDKASSSILASGDGGASFTPIATSIPKVENWQQAQLASAPGQMRDLWLAAPYGLLHAPNPKSRMQQVPGVDVAWRVSFGAPAIKGGYPGVFLWGKVKGVEGLWLSDDTGKSWRRINDDAHRYGNLKLVAGDPLEHGTVYIAPEGRGVLMGRPVPPPAR